MKEFSNPFNTAGQEPEKDASMAKRTSKKTAGRESIVERSLPEVPPEEQQSRFMRAQAVNQELHELERKLSGRIETKGELKAKLDAVTDECKSLDQRCNKLRIEVSEIIDGRSTGRLPFGAGVGADRVIKPGDIETTPAKLMECYYPQLLDSIKRGDEPAVNKAMLLETGPKDVRYVVVLDGDHKRLLMLHATGWQAASSAAELKDVTGKLVDFMDARLVVGTADECPLIAVDFPHGGGAGGRTDPGGATRGSAVDRARASLGDSMTKVVELLEAKNLLEPALTAPATQPTAEELELAALMAIQGTAHPRRWLKTATLDELSSAQIAVDRVELDPEARQTELVGLMADKLKAGIPELGKDDFDELEAAGSNAEEPGEAPDDSPDADEAPEGSEAPAKPKRGGGKKSGAAKKTTAKKPRKK